ncbi:MAG TPA: hypothetical protein PKD00_09270 [Burkholderiales bacterium]|nr:hypothetical protein [Burkholderiales bacterium]
MDVGRKHRLKRIIGKYSFPIIVPIDHSFTRGPIDGLFPINIVSNWISHPNISTILAHKGTLEHLLEKGLINLDKALILQLNGCPSTNEYIYYKKQLTSVEVAINLGCDGVSLDLNFDGKIDGDNFAMLGNIVDQAHAKGLPMMCMISSMLESIDEKLYLTRLRHYIRSAIEMNVDIIKINSKFRSKCFLEKLFFGLAEDVVLLIAGGEKLSINSSCEYIITALNSGARGVCIGRNIFQQKDAYSYLNNIANLKTN